MAGDLQDDRNSVSLLHAALDHFGHSKAGNVVSILAARVRRDPVLLRVVLQPVFYVAHVAASFSARLVSHILFAAADRASAFAGSFLCAVMAAIRLARTSGSCHATF